MRLDHLLSKETEKVRVVLLSSCQGVHAMDSGGCRCWACTSRYKATEDIIGRAAEREVMRSITESRMFDTWTTKEATQLSGGVYAKRIAMQEKPILSFRWRCAWGTHPFSSRTRWLRLERPMVLCWRRHGRVGGCRIKTKVTVARLLHI